MGTGGTGLNCIGGNCCPVAIAHWVALAGQACVSEPEGRQTWCQTACTAEANRRPFGRMTTCLSSEQHTPSLYWDTAVLSECWLGARAKLCVNFLNGYFTAVSLHMSQSNCGRHHHRHCQGQSDIEVSVGGYSS